MTEGMHPREKLVKTAAKLVHQQGWTITGINQILTEAGIPKGSFYYYFRSKEALGIAVLQLYHESLTKILDQTLLSSGLSPGTAIDAYFEALMQEPLSQVFRYGCPAGNLAAEIATQSPRLLTEAMRTLDLYQDAWNSIVHRIYRAHPDGLGDPAIDRTRPTQIATTISVLVQGALYHVKYTASFNPLESARTAIHEILLGSAQAAFVGHIQHHSDLNVQALAS